MAKEFKVTLAATVDPMKDPEALSKIKFPCYISPKFDGIRMHVKDEVGLSRKNISIPNLHSQEKFKGLDGFDGELIIGNESDYGVYNRTQSGVMTIAGTPDVTFWLMDNTWESLKDKPFTARHELVETYVQQLKRSDVKLIPHKFVENLDQLLEAEARWLTEGFEGICGRKPDGPYKWGRSTLREGILWKLKRFEDFEAPIVGFEEAMSNDNEAVKDNLGYTKRSSHKDNKTPLGRVGTFLVEYKGQVERIAPGAFKHEQLKVIWSNQEKYLGLLLKCRHFPHGALDKVRHGRAVGFRSEIDL